MEGNRQGYHNAAPLGLGIDWKEIANATIMPPLRGWESSLLDTFYHNAAPTGLGIDWKEIANATIMPPLWGWESPLLDTFYHNAAPLGLGIDWKEIADATIMPPLWGWVLIGRNRQGYQNAATYGAEFLIE